MVIGSFFVMELQKPKSNTFSFGDNSSVAVVSLWTPTEVVAQKLGKENYGIIGNLYSGERGIDTLVRSLSAHPEITHLIVTGVDTAKSGQVLLDFFEKGFSEGQTKDIHSRVWKINSEFEGYIETDIPRESLETLRTTIQIVQWDFKTPFDPALLKPVSKKRNKQVFEKKTSFQKKYFGEVTTHVFRSDRFMEACLHSFASLIRFGQKTADKSKLFNAVFVLENETGKDIPFTEDLGFSRLDAQKKQAEWAQTIDSLRVVQRLNSSMYHHTPVRSEENPGSIEFDRVQDQLLCSVSLLHQGALEFPILLYSLQKFFHNEIAAKLISIPKKVVLTVILSDYWISTDDLPKANALVETLSKRYLTHWSLLPDARGNFVIYISQGEIVVEHLSFGNELLYMYTGQTALELRDQIMAEGIVGTIAHGIYLGTELQKAEIALKHGLGYVQDKPLDFSKKA